MMKKVKLQKKKSFNKYILVIFAVGFGVIGLVKLFTSNAYVPRLTYNDGEFSALTPARIYDAQVYENQTVQAQITGKGGVPISQVTAVVANITVAYPDKAGFLTLYPTGAQKPTASTINFSPSSGAIANQITVPVGPDGMINIFNMYGSSRVIIDVSGYFTAALGNSGARYVPLNPARIYDKSVEEATTTSVPLSGLGGVPYADVSAVVVNVTAAGPTKNGYLTAFPSLEQLPTASTINFNANVGAIANQITVKLGTDGKLNFYNPYGKVRLIVDVSGYYTTNGNRYVAMNPERFDDSGYKESQTKTFKVTGAVGIPTSHVKAVVANITVASPSKNGYVTAYPYGSLLPDASTINFSPSTGAIANQIVLPIGKDGKVNILNRFGNTRVVIDISGYFVNNDQLETIAYDSTKKMPANPNTSLTLVQNDVSYGPSPSQTYDIYESANRPDLSSSNLDTIVWFYGGGWESGDNGLSTGYDTIVKHLAAQYGYKLVAANYRKSGEAPYPAQYQDAIAVIKDLKYKAQPLEINKDRIIIGGFSAGGDLATMAGLGYNVPQIQPPYVSAAVAQQSALVYRIMTFATPFDKVTWSNSYFQNASPVAGLNKLLAIQSSTVPYPSEYAKLNALQFASSDDPPHYTVMSQSDTVIPFNTQLAAMQQIGMLTSTVLQYGGPNGHASGLDTNIPALIEFLK